MRLTRRFTLVGVLSVATLLVAGPAGAVSLERAAMAPESFADDCFDGPADEATALRPHVWDEAGQDGPAESPHGDRADLRAAWIGVDGEDGFTANIQTTDLSLHPINTRFNFTYSGPLGEHFVTAEATETLEWAYSFGHVDTSVTPNRLITDGDTTGSVDVDNATLTIDLPDEAVPPAPTPAPDGSSPEVTMPILGMESQLLLGTSVTGGLLLITDASDFTCDAILYEAVPPTETTESTEL